MSTDLNNDQIVISLQGHFTINEAFSELDHYDVYIFFILRTKPKKKKETKRKQKGNKKTQFSSPKKGKEKK